MAFFEQLDLYNKNTSLIDESENVVLYSHLLSDANVLAEKTGDRCLVFFICRNCIESIVGYIGFLRNKIVPVFLSDTIPFPLLKNLFEQYHPKYLYLPEELVRELDGFIIYKYRSYVLFKLKYEEDYTLNANLALLLTTSGSTGSPKLVRQSYQNIKANTESIIEYLDIKETDRAVTTLPMSYTYGLSIITTHLYKGASIILTNASLMEKRLWTLMKKEKTTTFGGVPYTYEMLKRLRFERIDLPDLRYITQAGGKLSKELSSEIISICKKKNIKFIVMYGQTEATARMSYLPWEYAELKSDSIGIAIPGGRFYLEDDKGNRIESDETIGELVYAGKNVTLGYAENRFDLERGDDNCGILHTGDMAKSDKDGFYYIVGRKKRFLKLFGNRVNLDEIEGLLKKEGIECACTGDDDNLYIYITDERKKEEVNSFLFKNTEINKNGYTVFIIDSIPRNESGKIIYSILK